MKHDWQDWIDRMANEDVSEEEMREFQCALQDEPDNIDSYLEALLTDASLEMKDGLLPAEAINPSAPQPAELSLSVPDAPHNTQPTSGAAIGSPVASGALSTPVGANKYRYPTTSSPGNKIVYLALVACLALLVGFAWMWNYRSNPADDRSVAAYEPIATISDASGIADAAGLRIGTSLSSGEVVVPAHSNIAIAMHGGARLDVNGPARLRLDSPAEIFLHSGRLGTYAPDYANGFVINTKQGKVTDIGTHFVTVSRDDGQTEVHVIDGIVKAETGNTPAQFLRSEEAAVFSDSQYASTDYLAHRLKVPVIPALSDEDGDGFADVIEKHYGTRLDDPASKPAALRIHDAFSEYSAGSLSNAPYQGVGKISQWTGSGAFLEEGLSYSNNGKQLATSAGSLQTTGEKGAGALILPDGNELPNEGVIYVSFLMQQPEKNLNRPFSGLLLYSGEYKEQLFVGELAQVDSYGSRYAEGNVEDAFSIPADQKTRLFVIRVDRTRMLTDVFVDPALGADEQNVRYQKRYQDAPEFDRIQLRSGSDSGAFAVKFDEIRVGLTWDSVLPIK